VSNLNLTPEFGNVCQLFSGGEIHKLFLPSLRAALIICLDLGRPGAWRFLFICFQTGCQLRRAEYRATGGQIWRFGRFKHEMSAIFPKWTNQLPLMIVIGVVVIGSTVTAGVWYYFTPKYTRVGYQPIQPVAYSHATHAGQLGLDCRYCHSAVEKSWYANLPSSSTCMNCHNQVLKDDPRLALVRESAASGRPIPWVQIHRLPDFVYFNHSVHVTRGISCVECHGQINQMEEVQHAQPLNMTFCLACHRNPAAKLRPVDKVTDLNWRPESAIKQNEFGTKAIHDWKVESLQNCSACHR
jgi:formate-dependent nitrite reductase cytochrome c552 subunit